MKEFFKKTFYNQFFKVFSFNGIIVVGKLITSFIVSKVSAIYLGPSGYAIVGNLKNILQGVLGVTANGFESGLIKYIAENKENKNQFSSIVSSALTLSICLSLFVGFFLFVFSNQLSVFILKDASLTYIFRYLSIFLPLISLNFLVVYIVNGLQKFRLYTLLISITNVLNAVITFFLVYFFSLKGALMASILIPVLSFIFSILIKDVRIFFGDAITNLKTISVSFLRSIFTYIVMAIYSTILLSLSYLLIRNNIISFIDTSTAGLWEAMNKLSSFYMIFFSSLFTLYLLPLLASNKTIKGYAEIMSTYFKYLIPFIIVLFLGILFFRVLLIKLFLTNEFLKIEQFFYLQLFGDFIKIIAFSFAYQFHAKKMVIPYFITDAILYVSFYLLSMHWLKYHHLQGVFYAYIVSTLLYLITVCLFVFSNRTKHLKSENQFI
ncbi:oligosaccharide flippase family protein [Mariniflexile litorale]|uniref:Oligosaccharide flippase family protein n=1 Tax=Mariniflexile litorale TaxID=3045158 RepID=A0AAU7EBX5_9FLAO|nr:oligosaccharide flippase family protein [Mariniflexile sp. KMM 9835]MDQ8210414.1 oligosaccharide flippase family protein [Mariniflexile sp. KMM 9835]